MRVRGNGNSAQRLHDTKAMLDHYKPTAGDALVFARCLHPPAPWASTAAATAAAVSPAQAHENASAAAARMAADWKVPPVHFTVWCVRKADLAAGCAALLQPRADQQQPLQPQRRPQARSPAAVPDAGEADAHMAAAEEDEQQQEAEPGEQEGQGVDGMERAESNPAAGAGPAVGSVPAPGAVAGGFPTFNISCMKELTKTDCAQYVMLFDCVQGSSRARACITLGP